jgi:transposase
MPNATLPPRRMRFSFESRCRIVQLVLAGESPQAAAAVCGASRASGYRLWRRYEEGGWEALRDRPSRPKRQPRRLAPESEAEIAAMRARTQAGPLVLSAILERPASTIGKVLRRLGLSPSPSAPRSPATSVSARASSSTSTRSGSTASGMWASASSAPASGAAAGRGGTFSTSPSTTTRASPTPKSSRARMASRAPPSSPARSPGTASRASSSSASSPTMPAPTAPPLGGSSAPATACAAASPAPTGRGRTARRRRSSRRSCASGPTAFAYPTSEHRSRALPGFLRWYNRRRPHGSLGGRPPISRVSNLCGQYT